LPLELEDGVTSASSWVISVSSRTFGLCDSIVINGGDALISGMKLASPIESSVGIAVRAAPPSISPAECCVMERTMSDMDGVSFDRKMPRVDMVPPIFVALDAKSTNLAAFAPVVLAKSEMVATAMDAPNASNGTSCSILTCVAVSSSIQHWDISCEHGGAVSPLHSVKGIALLSTIPHFGTFSKIILSTAEDGCI
jgi:hypothetical protein